MLKYNFINLLHNVEKKMLTIFVYPVRAFITDINNATVTLPVLTERKIKLYGKTFRKSHKFIFLTHMFTFFSQGNFFRNNRSNSKLIPIFNL